MIEILKSFGFKSIGHCNCAGYHAEKFRKEETEVWIRPKSYKFCIKEYGKMVTAWLPAQDIKETLTTYFQNPAKNSK